MTSLADRHRWNDTVDLGVTVGKFTPFHKGHEYLIRTALDQCDQLVVIVVMSDEYRPHASVRGQWIKDTFLKDIDRGNLFVRFINKDSRRLDDDDSEGWAAATLDLLGRVPNKVFTSEDYGPRWTRAMQNNTSPPSFIEHIPVDPARVKVPISGTQCRKDIYRHWDLVPDATRPFYTKRVCVLGAESTGKTTLCETVARQMNTVYVPEFGRHYTEAMPDPETHVWDDEDFELIEAGQRRMEEYARLHHGPLHFVDTSFITTALFSEVLLGTVNEQLRIEALASPNLFDLYVLCDVNTPFEQDITGIRMEEERQWFDREYRKFLKQTGRPWIEAKGTPFERASYVRAHAFDLINENPF